MSTVIPQYPFDPTGLAASNKVVETQAIKSRGTFDHYYIVPRVSPFFTEGAKLRLYPVGTNPNNPAQGQPLEEGVHYNFGYHFTQASHTIGKPVYGAITFYDRTLEGQLRMELQTLGGDWVLDDQAMSELLLNIAHNPRIATWEQLVELPHQFPVVDHDFNVDDFVGMGEVVDELGDIEKAILQANEGGLQQHIEDHSNPHEVTKLQIGLGLLDNFPTATSGEAIAGTANNRFMTPLRTKQLIDTIATAALLNHQADYTNPHQVTKAQVGLGNVANLALASQAEAEAGASHARFMTPLRVREAITAIVGVRVDSHVGARDNPHQVTKAQVGLGSVPNIGVATDASALQGLADDGIITPRLLSMVLNETVGEGVTDHIMDNNNPHGVTKAQVGLDQVQNFGIATEAEAQDATAVNKYMTPLAVRQAINALVGDSSNAHVTDYTNPHNVTAAQVGAYDRDEVNQLLSDKLDQTDIASDSARVYGLDQEGLGAWVGSLTAGDSRKFDGKTYLEVSRDILTGKAADSVRLDGRTYLDLVTEISGAVDSSSIQFNVPEVPLIYDDDDNEIEPPTHWVLLGKFRSDLTAIAADLTLLVTGGRNDESLTPHRHHTVLLEISSSFDRDGGEETYMVIRGASVKEITPGSVSTITLGYRSIGVDDDAIVEVYVKTTGVRNELTLTELSNRFFQPAPFELPTEVADLITVEPAGIVYPPVFKEGSAEIEALQVFVARRDNPHGVTKAQVGLGNVANNPSATSQEAITGTATNRFMTPASTAAKVDGSIDILCTELIGVIDDALTNIFI